MPDENTLDAFLSEDNLSAVLSERVLQNLSAKEKDEMVFNITQVKFDFPKGQVKILYYINDGDYPDVVLTVEELNQLLKSKCT